MQRRNAWIYQVQDVKDGAASRRKRGRPKRKFKSVVRAGAGDRHDRRRCKGQERMDILSTATTPNENRQKKNTLFLCFGHRLWWRIMQNDDDEWQCKRLSWSPQTLLQRPICEAYPSLLTGIERFVLHQARSFQVQIFVITHCDMTKQERHYYIHIHKPRKKRGHSSTFIDDWATYSLKFTMKQEVTH